MDVAVIARVPFDEGTLTGTLTKESKWPEGDWRNIYFVPENLIPSVERADALKELLREWNEAHPSEPPLNLPELALRFILSNPDVDTIIPGMRKTRHVEANIAASNAGPLPAELLKHCEASMGKKASALVWVTNRSNAWANSLRAGRRCQRLPVGEAMV